MRRSAIIIIVFSFMFLSCNKKEDILPEGSIIRTARDVSGFKEITIDSGFELILSFGDTVSVEVETYENLHQYIGTLMNENRLEIRRREDVSFTGAASVKIYVTAAKINVLNAAGGSRVSVVTSFVTDNLAMSFSGGSSISCDALTCTNLSASLTGGSVLELKGTATVYALSATGGSKANGFDFTTKQLDVDASGGSEINITVSEKLSVTASGGSMINYKGNGVVISSNLTGGSQINRKL